MEIEVLHTRSFEEDLQRLHPSDSQRVARALENYLQRYAEDPGRFLCSALQLHRIKLLGGFDSSLYAFRIGQSLRLLVTIDEDPLYDQHLVTLLRVVHHGEMKKVLHSTAELLYEAQLAEMSYAEEEAHG